MGIVSRMEPYVDHFASFLTEGTGRIIELKKNSGNKYQNINSLSFTYDIEQSEVEYVPFAAVPQGSGENGSEITMAFTRRYYDANDIIIIEGSKQTVIVMDSPVRKADNYWEYSVKLQTNSYTETLREESCQVGMLTRWIGNVQPEFHSQGYTKYQSNVEKHVGWLTETRVDVDASSRYEALEDNFIKVCEEGNEKNQMIFRIPGIKKLLLDNFMAARNQMMLWQRTTMDANGKCYVNDRKGRPLIAGDGIIPQINRYASKINYVNLTAGILNRAIVYLTQKCANANGNKFVFAVNSKLYYDLQVTLSEFLANHKVDNIHMIDKEGEGLKVGATYTGYKFASNEMILHQDRALDFEYKDRGFGIMIDLTGDKTSGADAIAMFTLQGKQMIQNTLTGVGIKDGEVASSVAGVHHTISGYHGVAVFNPYRSCILIQS